MVDQIGLWAPQALREKARELSQRFGFPELTAPPVGAYLALSHEGLELFPRQKSFKPIRVDFLSGEMAHLWRKGLVKSDLFARAIGATGSSSKVLDATAGFGRDMMKLLLLGCQVTAAEQSPAVFALLQDGVERALRDERWNAQFGSRLKLCFGPYTQFLPTARFDVVYLDPMFPEKRGSALAGKHMQVLQDIIGEAQAPDELVSDAFEYCRRVVLKRPSWLRYSETIGGRKTQHIYKGKSVNYEVWITPVGRD